MKVTRLQVLRMDIRELESIVEAILFASGDPVKLSSIAEALEIDKKTAKSIMNNMIVKFKDSGRGIMIRQIEDGYQLCSKPAYFDYIRKVIAPRQKQQLSQAAYETLSIVAYNQPVTRAKIEDLRGVNSDSAIARLLERNLIAEAGRLDAPGRPILYKTTEEFLRCFGLSSISELPEISLVNPDEAVPAEE
jgi:segregation and condensation protein B